ncbi:hypothetical protein C4K20_1122 [Pseudomonas chlororaphis subsp. aurantiaca]|nr:hypothetical protein C4K20_1122 [Pseudomonas chlororaphis subsp. aurantiaca]
MPGSGHAAMEWFLKHRGAGIAGKPGSYRSRSGFVMNL